MQRPLFFGLELINHEIIDPGHNLILFTFTLIRFRGLPEFSSGPPPRSGLDQETMRFFLIFLQYGRFQDRLQGRFQDKQTPPSNSLKLIEFETY
jgi:hypothetical protein